MQPEQQEAVRRWGAAAVLLLLAACARETAAPAPAASFRWSTGGKTYACVVTDADVGGVTLQTLTVAAPGGTYRRPPTGEFLNALFLDLPEAGDERLLVTQWTSGANTYDVEVYRVAGGRVTSVLTTVTATTELALLDVNDDGTLDLVVPERGAEGGMAPATRVAYLWRGASFERMAPVDVTAPAAPDTSAASLRSPARP
jgi:hypothetical protein